MIVIKEKTVGSEHYKALGWKSIMPIPARDAISAKQEASYRLELWLGLQ